MRILMLHLDPGGGQGGATHMAWRTADALAARGHDVALAGTPPARGGPAAFTPLARGPDRRWALRAAVTAACAHPTPGAAPTAGWAADLSGPVRPRHRVAAGTGTVPWLGAELPGSVGGVAAATGWVPDVVHVTDLVDPRAAARGRALAEQAGAVFALTPATDPALWHDPVAGGALARRADVVFALSAAERARLAQAGVAVERLAPLAQAPQLASRRHPDPAGFRDRVGARGPLVLFLGRKLPSKGHQHLIAAAPAILDRHPGATIVVAGPEPSSSSDSGPGGDGPDHAGSGRDHLAERSRLQVRELGALDEDDKHSALLGADVLVLPSVADAFPLVFVEAWTCGVPVVSGPFPGAHQVVRHGVDGLVVDADAAAVATAVNDLLANPERRQAMGHAGQQRAIAELSWDAVAADAERGYRSAVRRAPQPLAAINGSSET